MDLIAVQGSVLMVVAEKSVNRGSSGKNVWLLKIPTPGVPCIQERLLWIAYFKEQENNKCPFCKCTQRRCTTYLYIFISLTIHLKCLDSFVSVVINCNYLQIKNNHAQ